MKAPFSNIWFVDDDVDEHEFFDNTLKEISPDTEVTHFYDCNHLLRLLFQCIPDIIFLDIYMPGDGLTCLKKIREYKVFDKLPIIIYTGTNYYRNVLYSYGYGATLFLLKQDDFIEMKDQIERLLHLDWTNHEQITEMHFHNNHYTPFATKPLPKPYIHLSKIPS